MDVFGHHFLRPQNTTSKYLRIVAYQACHTLGVMQIFINLTNKRLVRTINSAFGRYDIQWKK